MQIDFSGDKAKHFLAGLGISFLFSFWLLPAGLLAAALAGAGKELYDHWSGKGTPDWADFLVTVGGGVAGMAAHALLLWH